MDQTNQVYATLLTNINYLPGVLLLAFSLEKVQSRYALVILVIPGLPKDALAVLEEAKLEVIEVEWLEPRRKGALDGHDARFADTWTKLAVFGVDRFMRIVLLDSDMLVMRNPDDLFAIDLPHDAIAAAHACTCNPRQLAHYPKDWTPANCAHTYADHTQPVTITPNSPSTHHLLNSGLVVLTPSSSTFAAIKKALDHDPAVPTFRFPDQDFMAHFFRNRFLPLGYQYNALKTLRACHREMWRDDEVRIVHYIISPKPWQDRSYRGTPDEAVLHGWWWHAWDDMAPKWRDSKAFQSAVLPLVSDAPKPANGR